MNKYFLALTFFLLFNLNSCTLIKVYKLISSYDNAEFNYDQLNNIDEYLSVNRDVRKLFEPTIGNYKIYLFEAEYYGETPLKDSKKFHDILVVKTDSSNTILDAFHYTLEWAEPPFQFDLFRSSVKGILLEDDLELNSLCMIRNYGDVNERDTLNDFGLLDFNTID